MSPIEHQEGQFKIYIWPHEGGGKSKEAPHVHVFTPDGEVKIGLDPVQIIGTMRMREPDQRKALSIVRAQATKLINGWRRWHEAQD